MSDTAQPDQRFKRMFEDAIDEYLKTAKWCLGERHPDKRCFGYPATLLLFCVVEAMGRSLIESEKVKLGAAGKSDFRMLAHYKLQLGLSLDQIINLGKWYRNNLAHTAVLIEGIGLSPEQNPYPFEFSGNNEPRVIFVHSFYEVVQRTWNEIDRRVFNPAPTQLIRVEEPLTKNDGEPNSAMSYIPGGIT